METDQDKLFLDVAGLPVVGHTWKQFDQHPDIDDQFSWFDYRSKGFNDNRGLRIDHILGTATVHSTLTETGIDYELRGIEKPSDHAPIWAVYDI